MLPVALVEPDGLIVTTDGRYVRVIECDRVPNTITADPSELARIEDAFAHLCRIIPDRQGLDDLRADRPGPDRRRARRRRSRRRARGRAHDRAAGQPELAARARAAAGRDRADGASRPPAPSSRRSLRGGGSRSPTGRSSRTAASSCRRCAASARGRTLWETHREAAIESLRLAEQVDAALRRAGIETWLLDGTQALALLWERLHPAAERARPELLERLAGACEVATATTLEEAAAGRHRMLEAICEDRRGLDIGEDPAWLRHADGTLEETIHLATPPLATDPSWLAHLLTCPLPATLAVHISVGVRSREKRRQRRRWQRLRAAVRYKERRDRLVGVR